MSAKSQVQPALAWQSFGDASVVDEQLSKIVFPFVVLLELMQQARWQCVGKSSCVMHGGTSLLAPLCALNENSLILAVGSV